MPDREIDKIIAIIRQVTGVTELSPEEDFYDAGVSSIAALSLLVELEAAFDVSIPDDRFMTCRTANDLLAAVAKPGD
jgi:acyl carrier protein